MIKIDPNTIPFLFEEEIYLVNESSTPASEIENIPSGKVIGNKADAIVETPQNQEKKKNTSLLVVSDPGEAELALLQKILSAVSLKLEDIDLIRIDEKKDIGNYEKIILFTSDNWNGLHSKPYQISISAKTKILFADPLSSMINDISMKKKLWSQLKVLFQD